MDLTTLVKPSSVACVSGITSKKRALEQLAKLLSGDADDDASLRIYQQLTEREKLGSTSLGHGVALPHARVGACEKARGAFIKLDEAIDFDSPDGQATDLLFALMVPEKDTDEHLRIIAALAAMFNDASMVERLRSMGNDTELFNTLTGWQIDSEAS